MVVAKSINERRRYFRIKDDIILFHKEVSPEDVPELEAYQEHTVDSFSLSSRLDLLTVESRSLLRKVEREHPETADFLKVMEQKIDLLARALLAKDTEWVDQPTRCVSLSASGLAFEADVGFPLGSVLELKMILPPALIGILSYGRVVYCNYNRNTDSPGFNIAVDFVGLRERDRDLLIRHVVKRQLQQLREQKLGSA